MARERSGLSVFDVAQRMGLSDASIFDLESYEDELLTLYGLAEVMQFAKILSTTPVDLLCVSVRSDRLNLAELAAAVRTRCAILGVAVSEFEDRCGWHLANALQEPGKFLVDYSINGIREVCEAADVEWERVISGLEQAA